MERECGALHKRAFAALERARALRRKILDERAGRPLPNSGELTREMREERTDELDDMRPSLADESMEP